MLEGYQLPYKELNFTLKRLFPGVFAKGHIEEKMYDNICVRNINAENIDLNQLVDLVPRHASVFYEDNALEFNFMTKITIYGHNITKKMITKDHAFSIYGLDKNIDLNLFTSIKNIHYNKDYVLFLIEFTERYKVGLAKSCQIYRISRGD